MELIDGHFTILAKHTICSIINVFCYYRPNQACLLEEKHLDNPHQRRQFSARILAKPAFHILALYLLFSKPLHARILYPFLNHCTHRMKNSAVKTKTTIRE